MKTSLVTICALAAATLLTSLPDTQAARLRDDDGDGHYNVERGRRDRDRDRDRDHRHYRGYRRPYYYGYGPGVSRTTVVYRSSSRGYGSYVEVDVQRALARRGYYHGPIDGDIGPGTRAAIRRYQARHGLPLTGRIDRYLLRSLGV